MSVDIDRALVLVAEIQKQVDLASLDPSLRGSAFWSGVLHRLDLLRSELLAIEALEGAREVGP